MKLFRLATLAASAGLTLLICLWWQRSHTTCDEVAWSRTGRWYLTLQSLHGRVTVGAYPAPPFDRPLSRVSFPADRAKYIPLFHPAPGQKAWTAPLRHRETGEIVRLSDHAVLEAGYRLPHWALAIVAALPALAGIARRLWTHRAAARARRAGRCERCGYDLRATPGRCPECGHTAPGQLTPVRPLSPLPQGRGSGEG